MKDPSLLSHVEVLREIQALKASMREQGKRLYELSRLLQEKVRRQDTDEYTRRYVAYSAAHIKLAGGVEQGIQRAAPLDRLVNVIEQEQKQKEIEPKQAASQTKQAKQPDVGGLTDLVSVFGQEMIDAAR